MNRIHLLSPELISQIAAGEVIERPASVVKELLENSLDSGASSISIELEQGGLQKIRVTDNGCGMSPQDARLAFEAHATSKILKLDDLFSLGTLGFRGEALASIASISKLVLKTRPHEDRVGTRVEYDAGKELIFEEVGCPAGTDIVVTGLFHPVPARRKYMKTETTEYGHCFEILSQLAMAHPSVAFRFQKDGELVFELPLGQSLLDRVRSLYGGQTAEALLPVTFHQSNLLISGFVGKPELSRSSRKYQFIFVNGHPVENRLVSRAVQEAFHSLLMTAKYPWFVLDLQMDPAFVDINVHPRKLEVRFVNTQEIYRAVFGAVQHALHAAPLKAHAQLISAPDFPAPSPASNSFSSESPSLGGSSLEMNFETPAVHFEAPTTVSVSTEKKTLNLRAIAQVSNRYILAERDEGIVLIDQHAAHERVRYERFLKDLNASEAQSLPRQALLTPLQLDLGVESVELLRDYADDFLALGYEFEAFGGNTYLVRAVPAGLEKRDPEKILKEILADIRVEWRQNHVKNLRETLLTMTACRGAIKFGDPLTLPEMDALLHEMSVTPNYTHCPHGRPSMITWEHHQLEALFKRRNF